MEQRVGGAAYRAFYEGWKEGVGYGYFNTAEYVLPAWGIAKEIHARGKGKWVDIGYTLGVGFMAGNMSHASKL